MTLTLLSHRSCTLRPYILSTFFSFCLVPCISFARIIPFSPAGVVALSPRFLSRANTLQQHVFLRKIEK